MSLDHLEIEKIFEINETLPVTKGRSPEPNQGSKKAFTHSSSWIGNVRYNPQNQTMRVMMNGKGYGFCGVPESVYDSWEGSPSKGEFWWRQIKDQYNCSALMETELHDIQWPPNLTGELDIADVLTDKVPDTGRPDGITETVTSTCSECRFFVKGGACALVKGEIDGENGTCLFNKTGKSLPANTQISPIYTKPQVSYRILSVQESVTKDIIDREHELLGDGVPENEVHDILQEEFSDSFLSDLISETYTDTGSKINSEPSMHGEHGHSITDPKVRGYEGMNPDIDALVFDIPPLYNKEKKLIRETIGELAHQFNWMTPDYLQKVTELGSHVGGKFVLVRASAEAITDHRSEGEPHRRLLKGDELAQLTRTGVGKTTDINHLGADYKVDSDVLDAEYDPVRKESQMLVHLRDPEIIQYIEDGDIRTVSINAGLPRHMETDCNTGECFVVPRGLLLGELDGIAFTWVVNNPNGITWKGRHIRAATPGVKSTKIQLL